MNGKLIFNQMKKLFLVIALIATTFAAMAQSEIVSGRIIAHSTSTQTMVWSQSDQKTITVPDRERFQEDNLIELNLNTQNSSGKCTITNIADGAVYSFNIYDYEMRIYDRWGIHLFTSNDLNIGWDATYQGNIVQTDVYVYKVYYSFDTESGDVQRETKVGTVTVVR